MSETLVDGSQGTLAGVIADGDSAAGTFNLSIDQWRLRLTQQQVEAAGFGDGGMSSTRTGWSSWSFAATGVMRADQRLGLASMQGTYTVTGTVLLSLDGEHYFTGSVRASAQNISGKFERGVVDVQVMGVGQGVLTEV
jgi:hypothetical protein